MFSLINRKSCCFTCIYIKTQGLAETEANTWHQQWWLPARVAKRRGNDKEGEMKDELLFSSSTPVETNFLLVLVVNLKHWQFLCVQIIRRLITGSLTVIWTKQLIKKDCSNLDVSWHRHTVTQGGFAETHCWLSLNIVMQGILPLLSQSFVHKTKKNVMQFIFITLYKKI